MLLAGQALHDLIDNGVLDALHDHVNASSIDVRLGDGIALETPSSSYRPIRLTDRELPALTRLSMATLKNQTLVLRPGQFVLAHTQEEFNLPNNLSAEFRLRSSVARAGLNHLLACWIDAGFHGSNLTLELTNVLQDQSLALTAGMRIGQIIFYRHEPVDEALSYATKGRYNNLKGVSRASV